MTGGRGPDTRVPAEDAWWGSAAAGGQAPPPRRRRARAGVIVAVLTAVALAAVGALTLGPLLADGGDPEGGSGARVAPGEFPGPESTGVPAGVALEPSGPVTVERDGTVLDGLDVDGCLKIAASDVVIRRSRIRCAGYFPIHVTEEARGVLIEDVEIDGTGDVRSIAVSGGNYTLRRANVHDVGDGPRMGSNTVVEDSWIHDLVVEKGSHNDGIQSTGGSNIRILRNRIEHPHEQTSCILIGADLGPIHDVLIQGNLLNGGNYTVYAGGDEGYSDIRIVGNRFGRDAVYGTHSLQPGVEFSGNVWDDTGKPVT